MNRIKSSLQYRSVSCGRYKLVFPMVSNDIRKSHLIMQTTRTRTDLTMPIAVKLLSICILQ